MLFSWGILLPLGVTVARFGRRCVGGRDHGVDCALLKRPPPPLLTTLCALPSFPRTRVIPPNKMVRGCDRLWYRLSTPPPIPRPHGNAHHDPFHQHVFAVQPAACVSSPLLCAPSLPQVGGCIWPRGQSLMSPPRAQRVVPPWHLCTRPPSAHSRMHGAACARHVLHAHVITHSTHRNTYTPLPSRMALLRAPSCLPQCPHVAHGAADGAYGPLRILRTHPPLLLLQEQVVVQAAPGPAGQWLVPADLRLRGVLLDQPGQQAAHAPRGPGHPGVRPRHPAAPERPVPVRVWAVLEVAPSRDVCHLETLSSCPLAVSLRFLMHTHHTGQSRRLQRRPGD